jgi:O-antigen/teichoic acid export membrane protein
MKSKKTFNRYVINLLLTTVFGGVIGLINYLFNIFIARFSTEEIFGLYSTAIGAIYLIQIPAISIQNVLTKLVGENRKGDITKLKTSSIVSLGLIGFVLASVFYSSSSLFTSNMESSIQLILPLSLTLLLSFLTTIPKGILLGQEKVILVNVILLAETVLKFLMGYVGIKMGGNIHILILANAVPALLSFLITIPFIKSPKLYKKKLKIPYKSLALMTVSLLLLSTPYTLDLILTPEVFKAEYGALSLIGKLVYFACITIAFVMFSRLSNQKNNRRELETVSVTVFVTLIIGLLMTLGIYLFKDLIVDMAFRGKYTDISAYFVVFGLLMSSYAIVYMLANFFFSRDSYRYIGILFFVTVLQIFLFKTQISSFFDIIRNQVIVYSVLLVSTFSYFVYNFLLKKDGRKD